MVHIYTNFALRFVTCFLYLNCHMFSYHILFLHVKFYAKKDDKFIAFQQEKREIPSTLRKILAVDAYLTNAYVNQIEHFLPMKQLKMHYTTLEVKLHIFGSSES